MSKWSSNWPPEERWPVVVRVVQRALGLHGGNGNAEDCPTCSKRTDLPYPFLCTDAS